MDPTIAYIAIVLIGLIEGGEFAVLFGAFLARFAPVEPLTAGMLLVGAFVVSDMLWYRHGAIIYRLPILRQISPLLTAFDRKIHTKPYMVALVARFSYGLHHATIARYRTCGVGPWRMLGITLGTLAPWMLIVGAFMAGLTVLSPQVAPVFHFVEYLFTLAFIFFILVELRVTTYLRHSSHALNEAFQFIALMFLQSRASIRYAYGTILTLLFALIVVTPLFVHSGAGFFSEAAIEAAILLILTTLSAQGYRAYRKRMEAVQDTLLDMSKHVGALNLQAVQIEAMVTELTHIPENKRDLSRLLTKLNTNILAAVDAPWVLTRIVDMEGRTLTEQCTTRHDAEDLPMPTVSNRAILGEVRPRGYYLYRSEHRNLNVRVACAMPRRSLNRHQELVVRTAVNSLAMVYLVFLAQQPAQDENEK